MQSRGPRYGAAVVAAAMLALAGAGVAAVQEQESEGGQVQDGDRGLRRLPAFGALDTGRRRRDFGGGDRRGGRIAGDARRGRRRPTVGGRAASPARRSDRRTGADPARGDGRVHEVRCRCGRPARAHGAGVAVPEPPDPRRRRWETGRLSEAEILALLTAEAEPPPEPEPAESAVREEGATEAAEPQESPRPRQPAHGGARPRP